MGGVYIAMAHLGPANVASRFPGMVRRCADCGFDLAGGRVEVVPTAHYMMGGVEFEADCTTTLPGLYAAGEDCGGVHFREDFPEIGDLDETRYIRLARRGDGLHLESAPVEFSIVRPGESLVDGEAGSPPVAG